MADISDFLNTTSSTSLTDIYHVEETDNPVNISLTIGEEGQSSLSVIKIDNHVLENNLVGSVLNLDIGSNSSIAFKFLTILTIITDVDPEHNMTRIDFEISGGRGDYFHSMEKTVLNQGDSVAYKIEIFFIR